MILPVLLMLSYNKICISNSDVNYITSHLSLVLCVVSLLSCVSPPIFFNIFPTFKLTSCGIPQ